VDTEEQIAGGKRQSKCLSSFWGWSEPRELGCKAGALNKIGAGTSREQRTRSWSVVNIKNGQNSQVWWQMPPS
jgi:hypothetical protein